MTEQETTPAKGRYRVTCGGVAWLETDADGKQHPRSASYGAVIELDEEQRRSVGQYGVQRVPEPPRVRRTAQELDDLCREHERKSYAAVGLILDGEPCSVRAARGTGQ
jgi:hypothetical protein